MKWNSRRIQSRIGPAAHRPTALLAAAACGAALVGALLTGAPPTSAAASPWSVQQVPPTDTSTPAAQFDDVSCPTRTSCMAVGEYVGTDGAEYTLSEQWNGSTWRIIRPVSPAGALSSSLTDVSCVSSRSCEAIGQIGATLLAESWNGTSWRRVAIQRGSLFLNGMSCATASSCIAVADPTTEGVKSFHDVAEHWNGHRWSALTPKRPLAFTYLQGVSCPAARSCYVAGWATHTRFGTQHPLVERWNGTGWSVQAVRKPASANAALASISCPTTTSCTAVGSLGSDNIRPLVEDLSQGRWTEGLPGVPAAAENGTASFYGISCGSPRVCTALLGYLNSGEEATWATASRGATGGFRVTLPPGDVSSDRAAALSCRPVACELVGSLNSEDGQGDHLSSGTTLAERGSGGHFTAQVTLNPAGTAGGSLTSVSCVASGFCAAAATSANNDTAPHPLLVRASARGPWTVPAGSAPASVQSVSCTSAAFCVALDSATGAETWNGSTWTPISTPSPYDASQGGLVTVSCTATDACVAVGATKTKIGASSQAVADRWNGSTWTALEPPAPAGALRSGLSGVSCTSPTHCVAAGYYLATAASQTRALIETWDSGTGWTIGSPDMPVVNNFPQHTSVSCATASACMVTYGDWGEALARWWNGKAWAAPAFVAPTPRSQVTSVYGVSCPTSTSCTAVGTFDYSSGSGALVQSWNGSKWTVVAAPKPAGGDGALAAVSCPSITACTAVGVNQRIVDVPFAEIRS
jgi:hypothetical protein